jgi:hypothetical protein
MNERRFLRVLTISAIVILAILVSFQVSVYAQSDLNRAAGILGLGGIYPGALNYPTFGLAGYGLGLNTLVGGIPYTQQISAVQNTPYFSSAYNKNVYANLLTYQMNQDVSFQNAFASYNASSMAYRDPFSLAAAEQMSYYNAFGVGIEQGRGVYRDPLYMTAGAYSKYASPVGGYSIDTAVAQSAFGGAMHLSTELALPHTYYGTSVDQSYGLGAAGYNVQHAAFGLPTALDFTGLARPVVGQLTLQAAGSELAAMGRGLSDVYFSTPEGMLFIANPSYYNANSYGGSNWYFPAEISSYEQVSAGGITAGTGYQLTGGLANYTGGALAGWASGASSLAGSAFLSGAGATGASTGTGSVGVGFTSGTGVSYGGTNVGW